ACLRPRRGAAGLPAATAGGDLGRGADRGRRGPPRRRRAGRPGLGPGGPLCARRRRARAPGGAGGRSARPAGRPAWRRSRRRRSRRGPLPGRSRGRLPPRSARRRLVGAAVVNRPVVAVVGAGFSGLLTALHLLTARDGPTVRLFERRGVFGRGLAYGTDNAEHLLNVRAANMSAFPDRPDHFTEWLATHDGWRSQGGFVTRGAYGDYLQDMLREAMFGGAGGSRLLLEADGIE